MIQWMHQLSKSWLATLLMGGLALSFVVWGIADVFTGQTTTSVATVGSTDIEGATFQRYYRVFLRNEGQQMGADITPEQAQKMGLGQVALEQMISRTALDNATARMHMTISDDALTASVRAIPNFQGANGQFNHDQFLQVMQQNDLTEAEFLSETRKDMARDQLDGALEQGFALPDGYVQALFLFYTERRAADYVIVSPDSVGPIAPPSDAVLAAYVKAHPERFSTPEYRDISYAMIGPADVAGQVTVTEAMITQDYNAHKSTYQVPEKRDVQQLEFATEADAQAARAKLDKGETFDQLAAEKNVKPADLDLGTLTKADMGDPARGDAAFALKEGEVSQPVKGALGGYMLMKVLKITPEVNHPLADVHDTIKNNLALQTASGKLIDIVNAFEDARSGGADIPTAAKKTGMKTGHVTTVDKAGLGADGQKVADLPADPEFLTQAFAAEEGEDNDPFQAKSGEYYAVKVNGRTPPKLKTLDQVRDEAVAAWTQEQRGMALAKKAADLAAQAQHDGNLAGIAKTLKVPVQHSPALNRQTNDTTFSADFVQLLFNTRPGGIQMAPQAAGLNAIIAQVTGVAHDMTPQTAAQLSSAKAQLSEQAAGDLSVSFANASRLQQGVKIDQRVLQSVIGGNQ
jgi:peptidyl-prolyl cis-trans isomerase D